MRRAETPDPEPLPRLMRLPDVLSVTGSSRATIYRMMGRAEFPRPIRFGSSSCWDQGEIRDWIEAKKRAR